MLDTLTDWGVRLGRYRLILEAPDEIAATDILINRCDPIADGLARWKLWECLIFYPGCRRPYRIPASITATTFEAKTMSSLITDIRREGLATGELFLSRPLILELASWLDYPDERFSLIRVRDGRQLALSAPIQQQILLNGVTLEEACRRRREDFTHPDDLEANTREIRQRLEPDNPDSKFEMVARTHDTNFGNWRQMAFEVRAIRCSSTGEVYTVSRGLGVESIPRPVSI